MSESNEIALAALRKMREKEGPKATFPSDKIWGYADAPPGSNFRPSAITWLSRKKYIEPTGRVTNAVTEARAGSKTPEYRFGNRLDNDEESIAGEPATDISSIVPDFQSSCDAVFRVTKLQILRLAASLLAKQFVILTGLAGSGKTKLAQAFAHWLSEVDGASRSHAVVPVGADWTGNENILGYPDGLMPGQYVSRQALQLILTAETNPDVPHFLILDEMNLSHVERYFADTLSAIESGEKIPLYEGAPRKAGEQNIPGLLALPPNLFIIGTVNVDETTYMFSPKVLDRANVIEFRIERTELKSFLATPGKPDLEKLDGVGADFAKTFVTAAASTVEVPASIKARYESEMILFFDILREHDAEFGFRVGHEAARFVHFYQKLGGFADDADWFDEAFDAVIVQKFLPKLHGSRSKLEGLLWALAWVCAADRAGKSDEDFLKECRAAGKAQDEGKFGPDTLESKKPRYPLSFDKVMRMWRKLVRDQFVTFAEA